VVFDVSIARAQTCQHYDHNDAAHVTIVVPAPPHFGGSHARAIIELDLCEQKELFAFAILYSAVASTDESRSEIRTVSDFTSLILRLIFSAALA